MKNKSNGLFSAIRIKHTDKFFIVAPDGEAMNMTATGDIERDYLLSNLNIAYVEGYQLAQNEPLNKAMQDYDVENNKLYFALRAFFKFYTNTYEPKEARPSSQQIVLRCHAVLNEHDEKMGLKPWFQK